jgi:hypothetical protein
MLIFSIVLIGLFSRCMENKDRDGRREIDNYLAEGKFLNDSVPDGEVKFYDKQGKYLMAKSVYLNGKKNGLTINYFENGKIKDSLFFSEDIPNGPSYFYDSLVELSFSMYHFYGLTLGPIVYYQNGKPNRYYFTDFENNYLMECKYDSSENCTFFSYNNQPIISEVLDVQRKHKIRLLYYLPNPPNFAVSYSIGKKDSNDRTLSITKIKSGKLFLDTLLDYPSEGSQYYLEAHFISFDSSINKVYNHSLKLDDSLAN